MSTPLAVLDLVPVASGSTVSAALAAGADLAARAEEFGYARYWVAEHHGHPGVAGVSSALVLALVGSATRTIRLGSAAVLTGHRTAASTVEEFGLLDAAFPGRVDLGLGRSGGGPPGSGAVAGTSPATAAARESGWTANGLRIPPAFSSAGLLSVPRFVASRALLQLPGATSPEYGRQVADVLALLAGTYRSPDGVDVSVHPGEGAAVQVWVLGSGGGRSAQVAGAHGLRFGANYHVAPAGVLEAADAYRASFVASADLPRPYLTVSADVVVAHDDDAARELAAGYGPWVRSIRTGAGAIPYPSPEQARALPWSEQDAALVADRVETRFVGSPARVADGLERLRDATGADELLITTITHDHDARVRSYELLAGEWSRR